MVAIPHLATSRRSAAAVAVVVKTLSAVWAPTEVPVAVVAANIPMPVATALQVKASMVATPETATDRLLVIVPLVAVVVAREAPAQRPPREVAPRAMAA
jgi:hypothetical protein